MADQSRKTLSGATGKALANEVKRMRAAQEAQQADRWKDSYQRYREARDLVMKQEYFDWGGPLYFQEDPQVLFAALYTPFQLERFLLLGGCICLDATLYVYTFLPLQLFVLLWHSISARTRRLEPGSKAHRTHFRIHPRHVTTVVNAAVLAVTTIALTYIDEQTVEDVLLAPQRNKMIGVHIVVLMELVRWCDGVLLKAGTFQHCSTLQLAHEPSNWVHLYKGMTSVGAFNYGATKVCEVEKDGTSTSVGLNRQYLPQLATLVVMHAVITILHSIILFLGG